MKTFAERLIERFENSEKGAQYGVKVSGEPGVRIGVIEEYGKDWLRLRTAERDMLIAYSSIAWVDNNARRAKAVAREVA